MTPGVSIVICCHNSAKRLPETLRHLAAQKVDPGTAWEVVVIDNASTDDTAATARRGWPPNASVPLRVVYEPQAGLHHARVRGLREARHDITSFVDDDNWLAPDWIERVAAIFSQHAEVGACGGRTDPVAETTPAAWFPSIQGCYATGSQHARTGDVTSSPGSLLWGAGLTVRTAAVLDLFERGFVFRLSGRKGKKLSAGEDSELCFALRAAGWRFWYDDALVMKHFIPAARLTWDYALRLVAGMGDAHVMLDLYRIALGAPPFEKYPAWKKSWLFQMAKSFKAWLAMALSHPYAALSRPENSRAALKFQETTSSLQTLWSLRTRYEELKESIARLRRGSSSPL